MLGSLTRGQLFLGFWGTVLLDVCGAGLLLALGLHPASSASSR